MTVHFLLLVLWVSLHACMWRERTWHYRGDRAKQRLFRKSVNSAGNFSSLWLTQTFPHSFTIRSINQVKRLHLTIANNGLKKADVIVCCGQRGKGTVCFAVGQWWNGPRCSRRSVIIQMSSFKVLPGWSPLSYTHAARVSMTDFLL